MWWWSDQFIFNFSPVPVLYRCCTQVNRAVVSRPGFWSWTVMETDFFQHTCSLQRTPMAWLEVWGHWAAPLSFQEEPPPQTVSVGLVQRRRVQVVSPLTYKGSRCKDQNMFNCIFFLCRCWLYDNVLGLPVALRSDWSFLLLDKVNAPTTAHAGYIRIRLIWTKYNTVYRKYRRAANITKLILTLDDIVFIDTQVSRKVRLSHRPT